MFPRLRDIIDFLKELGFSVGSFKESLPSSTKKLAPFFIFWGSLIFFLGVAYYESAISLLPSPLRMGLHKSGTSLAAYFIHGFVVIADTATSYPTRTYLVALVVVSIMHWGIIRFTSSVLSLVNPLSVLKHFGTLPKEEQYTIVGQVMDAVAESSQETRGAVFRIAKAVVKFYALFRLFDFWYLSLLAIYVVNMAAVTLADALGAAPALGAKCLAFWGSWFDSHTAHEACRNAGFVEPDRYWPPAMTFFLVLASWFSLRHARTFRGVRMLTTLVASSSLLFCSLRIGEQRGQGDLTLWRIQIATEVVEEETASNKTKEWLLVSEKGGGVVLFDEASNTLHDFAAGKSQKGLVFLEQVPFETVGQGTAANPSLHRTADALACADCR